MNPLHTIPPFFCGKFLSDAVMLFAGSYAVRDIADIFHGTFSAKGIISMVLGLVIIGGFLVMDWRSLLQRKKFKFNFKIWK